MLIWCDKLASVPAVGITLAPLFVSSASILDAISPILGSLAKKRSDVNIEKQDTFSISIGTEEGFQYSLDAEKISVTFQHRLSVRTQSGGLPSVDLVTVARPYTEVLEDAIERLLRLASVVPGSRQRVLRRAGIVSTTTVDEEQIPPGLRRLIKYLEVPWGVRPDLYNFQLAAVVAQGDAHVDRCIHHFTRNENEGELTSLSLDWQRTLVTPSFKAGGSLKTFMDGVRSEALSYFEQVAVGERLHERINGEAEE